MIEQEIIKFLYWEQASQDTIDFKKTYVDLADDLIAGLLLSQIVYWHLPLNESGMSKLQVEKEGHLWIAKGREEWFAEIRITAKQFDRASQILVKNGLIEKKLFKFNGRPVPHIRLKWETFLPKLDEVIYSQQNEDFFKKQSNKPLRGMDFNQKVKSTLPKGESPLYPKVKVDFDQKGKSITEITTKITTENTYIDQSIMEGNIQELDLPDVVKKQIRKKIDRLIADKINLDDIEIVYQAVKDDITEYQFADILSTVLRETKEKIINIKNLLHTAIRNYKQTKVIHMDKPVKRNVRTAPLPKWMTERKEMSKTDLEEIERKKKELEEMLKNLH